MCCLNELVLQLGDARRVDGRDGDSRTIGGQEEKQMAGGLRQPKRVYHDAGTQARTENHARLCKCVGWLVVRIEVQCKSR